MTFEVSDERLAVEANKALRAVGFKDFANAKSALDSEWTELHELRKGCRKAIRAIQDVWDDDTPHDQLKLDGHILVHIPQVADQWWHGLWRSDAAQCTGCETAVCAVWRIQQAHQSRNDLISCGHGELPCCTVSQVRGMPHPGLAPRGRGSIRVENSADG